MVSTTVSPRLKITCLKRSLLFEDHFGLTQDCILRVFERVWKDHLPLKTTFFWQMGWSYNTGLTVFQEIKCVFRCLQLLSINVFRFVKEYHDITHYTMTTTWRKHTTMITENHFTCTRPIHMYENHTHAHVCTCVS